MSGFDIRDVIKAASATPVDASSSNPGGGPITLAALSRRTYSSVVVAGIVRALDFVVVLLVGLTVHLVYLSPVVPLGATYIAALAAIAVMSVLALQAIGSYTLAAFRALLIFGLKIGLAWTLVFLCAIGFAFFAKLGEAFSRVWLAGFYGFGLSAILVERFILSTIVTRMTSLGRFDRRTAIVGGGEPAAEMIRALEDQSELGIHILGVFDDRTDERSPGIVAGYTKLGGVADLVDYARRVPLDLVVVTLPISAERRLLQMLAQLWVLPIDIRLSAHASKLRLRPRNYSYIGSVPVLDVFDKPIADWDLVVKWLFDKVVGSLMLICLSPVLLLTAIAVRLDSRGPVLFRQKRYGFNNELVEVFKFRSMYVDQADAGAAKLVTKNDPRVTRVGRFLRKSSLDELPQLFNVVFSGNLSLVGPRPHAVQAKAENRLYDQVVDGYFARHKVKPGITGWAQINGWRGETDTEEKIQKRVDHDLYYIENWSVALDLYILAATPFALLKTENAY